VLAGAVGLAGFSFGCQKSEDHPPFAAGCEENCTPLPPIGVDIGGGKAGSASMNPDDPDAGPVSLEGKVGQLTDDSFVQGIVYSGEATISADGFGGSPVTGTWNGAVPEPDPYTLEGVARRTTNWVSVTPIQSADLLTTYRAVDTRSNTNVDLSLVSGITLDGIFNSISSLRSPAAGQVILFFRSAGTGAALPGLHVAMLKAQLAVYASASGWTLDDGTATTASSGLVLFGNVEPANSDGTQTVTVTRAATATTPVVAAGQFAVKVVQGAVTIARVDVQL